jgi:hypothetical protein
VPEGFGCICKVFLFDSIALWCYGQFEGKQLNTLMVGKDKSGQDRKIPLPPNIVSFLNEKIKDKLPQAPLLARSNGSFWDKDSWKYPIKYAIIDAKLPETVTTYTKRHRVITDLIHGGDWTSCLWLNYQELASL